MVGAVPVPFATVVPRFAPFRGFFFVSFFSFFHFEFFAFVFPRFFGRFGFFEFDQVEERDLGQCDRAGECRLCGGREEQAECGQEAEGGTAGRDHPPKDRPLEPAT